MVNCVFANLNNIMRLQSLLSIRSALPPNARPSPLAGPGVGPRPMEFLVRWRETKRANRFRAHTILRPAILARTEEVS